MEGGERETHHPWPGGEGVIGGGGRGKSGAGARGMWREGRGESTGGSAAAGGRRRAARLPARCAALRKVVHLMYVRACTYKHFIHYVGGWVGGCKLNILYIRTLYYT